MLTKFDRLRRSRTGSELLTTLKYFAAKPNYDAEQYELGAPFSALHGPCERCRIFARAQRGNEFERFCKFSISCGSCTPACRLAMGVKLPTQPRPRV